LKASLAARPGALDDAGKACRMERRVTLRGEDKRILLALEAAQGAQLVAGNGVGRQRAALHPPHVQHGGGEVDLLPPQVDQLGGA
jgi:hypothetical protein